MGGNWVLNEQRSRFGDNPRPGNVFLTIEHNEPKLKYTGTVNQPTEGSIQDFSFDGAIDGKEYTIKQDGGDRKVVFKRINDRTVESVQSLNGGQLRSGMTMSSDRKTLERTMNFKDRDGKNRTWTEIYEKKQ